MRKGGGFGQQQRVEAMLLRFLSPPPRQLGQGGTSFFFLVSSFRPGNSQRTCRNHVVIRLGILSLGFP